MYHPDTLRANYSYALTLFRLKRYEEAAEVFKVVIEWNDKVNGSSHRYTARSKYNYALTLQALQKYEDARGILE